MNDINIPREVVEAMRREFGTSLDWTAALRAGLKAWPRMWEEYRRSNDQEYIILPLPPKEKSE